MESSKDLVSKILVDCLEKWIDDYDKEDLRRFELQQSPFYVLTTESIECKACFN